MHLKSKIYLSIIHIEITKNKGHSYPKPEDEVCGSARFQRKAIAQWQIDKFPVLSYFGYVLPKPEPEALVEKEELKKKHEAPHSISENEDEDEDDEYDKLDLKKVVSVPVGYRSGFYTPCDPHHRASMMVIFLY